MKRKFNTQVSPKATAFAILIVLVLIQFVWWHGLVARTIGKTGGGGGGGGPLIAGPLVLTGRKDVLVETLAGAPDPGDTDGPGRDARFDSPVQLAFDAQGNLYVADCRNSRIRLIAPNGKTTTLAGSDRGYADGAASMARFNLPCGVTVGPDGSVYVADTGNNRIRRIAAGQVTTLAGSDSGLADGQGATARFTLPVAIAFGKGVQESDGLTVADAGNRRIRLLDLSGKTVGGWETPGTPVGIVTGKSAAVAAAGLLVPDGPRWKALHDIPINLEGKDGKQADFIIKQPVALCPAPGGWFVIDAERSCVFHLHDGKADLIAGRCQGSMRMAGWRDGNGETALFGQLGGIATDGQSHLYVCDTSNNSIRRITLPQDLIAQAEVRP